jgi:asparagine N-glycosylation enzyme membrane subunit Stt3
MRLLIKRPVAVLSAYVVPTAISLLLALLAVAVRQHLAGGSWLGLLLGLFLGCAIAAALAWGKVARVFALRALAEDAHSRR